MSCIPGHYNDLRPRPVMWHASQEWCRAFHLCMHLAPNSRPAAGVSTRLPTISRGLLCLSLSACLFALSFPPQLLHNFSISWQTHHMRISPMESSGVLRAVTSWCAKQERGSWDVAMDSTPARMAVSTRIYFLRPFAGSLSTRSLAFLAEDQYHFGVVGGMRAVSMAVATATPSGMYGRFALEKTCKQPFRTVRISSTSFRKMFRMPLPS
jgi:hypothetical protein